MKYFRSQDWTSVTIAVTCIFPDLRDPWGFEHMDYFTYIYDLSETQT
jgi:hypothetical protein